MIGCKQRALEDEQNLEPTAEAVEEVRYGALRRYAPRWGFGGA